MWHNNKLCSRLSLSLTLTLGASHLAGSWSASITMTVTIPKLDAGEHTIASARALHRPTCTVPVHVQRLREIASSHRAGEDQRRVSLSASHVVSLSTTMMLLPVSMHRAHPSHPIHLISSHHIRW